MIFQANDRENFCLELDHISIFDLDNLLGISFLKNLGFSCSKQVVERKNQGTISTVFFFENMYLELVRLVNKDIAKDFEIESYINILARTNWRQTGASPFGIGLRYKPIFNLPKSNTYNIEATNYNNFSTENIGLIEEPLCIVIPDRLALTTLLDPLNISHQQLTSHPLGIKKITNVNLTITGSKKLTDAVALLKDNKILTIKQGNAPLLELEFDRAARGETLDLQPVLPMIINY